MKNQRFLYTGPRRLYKSSFLPSIMSCDKFQSILKFLHFATTKDIEGTVPNRLQKLRPFSELLHNFQDFYTPGSLLVVDETVIPFHGRLQSRQYLHGKSHEYGCKLFKLCTPDPYTWNFSICGQKSDT